MPVMKPNPSQNPAPAGPNHEAFTSWAVSTGVQLRKNISPAAFSGSGIGIVAQERIKVILPPCSFNFGFPPHRPAAHVSQANEPLVTIPTNALITTASVPDSIKSTLEDHISVHGLLAATLTRNALLPPAEQQWREWRAVWPSWEDLGGMPITWDEEVTDMCPWAVKDILRIQRKKLDEDYRAALAHLPDEKMEKRAYMYHWLIVNTRTFYYVGPGMQSKKKKARPVIRDDCMALCAWGDYFNHADEGRSKADKSSGISVQSLSPKRASLSQAIGRMDFTDHNLLPEEVGEEIFVSYGNHSNDFLWAEYGFILATNEHDHIRLDHLILPRFTNAQKQKLRDTGFYGTYILDPNTDPSACHRTQVALRLLILPVQKWHRFINGTYAGEAEQDKIDRLIRDIVKELRDEAEMTLARVAKLRNDVSGTEMLRRRWVQILGMVGEWEML
ncbi:MAG: hypothetical protein M1817_001412 [Caeruleum heppii]|nr:MAG: hypothetical protein M1817_001412 [Caeruleum heppii]